MPVRPRAVESPTTRAARVLPALLVATLALLIVVAPAHAVDPAPGAASPSPSVSPSPTPSPIATPTPTPIPPAPAGGLPASFAITGRGYGHGVGLSQYGARGRALDGQTAEQILAHYFKGTTIGTVSTATMVRVLVLSGSKAPSTTPLRIFGRGSSWRIDGIDKTFPADALLSIWRDVEGTTGVWKLRVVSSTGAKLELRRFTATLVIRPASSATTLQVYSKPGTNDRYRGVLRVLIGSTASVVNVVTLEQYLRGVVPMEMPSSWPTQALRAQAISARSYAVRRLHPTTGAYDVYDDTRSQMYGGVNAERATTNAVVASTAGKVLKSGSVVASTFFHSTGGGATENNESAWVSSKGERVSSPISYLRGSADVDAAGRSYDRDAPYATWKTGVLTPNRLQTILDSDPRTAVGTLTSVTIMSRGVSGRVVKIRLVGSSGTKDVSGAVFRSVLNTKLSTASPVRSTLFSITPAS
jgi:stage II sporulation protein D